MNNKLKFITAAVITAAGLYIYGPLPAAYKAPGDLRDAPTDTWNAGAAMAQLDANHSVSGMEVPEVQGVAAVSVYSKSVEPAARAKRRAARHVSGLPAGGVAEKPVEWVRIQGGGYNMGADDIIFGNTPGPVHEVYVRDFEISRTPVTVEQFAECVAKNKCTAPDNGPNSNNGANCNWMKEGREYHPVNCVTWEQAVQYARFKQARLPTEAEWEYAATSGGRNQKYPWGNESPTCNRAVMNEGGSGCGYGGTMPVCSKPAGNTEHGLCDISGNVAQWVQDKATVDYQNTPTDGSAYLGPGIKNGAGGIERTIRGGSFYAGEAYRLRAQFRMPIFSNKRCDYIGFRIVR